jgi:tRNA threonylcarbamoyladenosine biosynthesis protein TsaB
MAAIDRVAMEMNSASTLAGVLLLAMDTATPAVTVALHDGTDVVAEQTAVDPRRHGELLAPGIERVLRLAEATPSDITDIAVGVGPGPFTGLRVGIVTARTLAEAVDAQVRGYCTLDVLAWEARRDDEFLVATDARRREVYWARYHGHRRIDGPHVDKPHAIGWRGPVIGRGGQLYAEVFDTTAAPVDPSAAALARLAGSGSVESLPPEPLYLRRPDAAKPGMPKSVMAR